ncbi:MAG: hypothetical protein R3B57_14295 [Phycisphaerales bacterium]
MMRRCFPRLALAACLLAPVAPVHAEHVEFTISVSAAAGDIVTTLGGAVATVVFDTDAPPTASDLQTVTFSAVAGRIDGVLYDVVAGANPSASDASPQSIAGKITAAELVYSQAGTPNMVVRLHLGSATLTLTVLSPAGPFSPSMTSLPDTTAAYRIADPLHYTVFAGLLDSGAGAFASIQRSNTTVASIGGVSYNVRLVDAPTDPCSVADLAEPYGVLDFSDVFAFLVAFGAGCP